MKFRDAWKMMKAGLKVRGKGWKGYWFIDQSTFKLTIHLSNGKEITEGDLGLTISNTLANDWEAL